MQPSVLIHLLTMTVDPSDNSYMPSLVVVSAGDSFTDMTELATISIRSTATVVHLLSDVKEVSTIASVCLFRESRYVHKNFFPFSITNTWR